MSTRLQKRLAEEIVKDVKNKRPRTRKSLLSSVGYAISTAEVKGYEIIGSKGVRDSLNELGFSEEGAKKVVAEILYSNEAKHHDRLDAADKVFKVHGSYAPDKHLNVNLEVEISPEIKALADKLNAIHGSPSI